MKVGKYLGPAHVCMGFDAKSKPEIIKFLLRMMTDSRMLAPERVPEVERAILEREALTSTGLGYGLALPHTRTDIVGKIQTVFARSQKGVDFEALDGNPVHFLFLVLAPWRCTDEYLKLVSAISSLMKNENVRHRLMEAKSKDEILQILEE
jgi:mannitol/fructose-specific phosphotransferase system IIA component (Ntr-type)